MNIKNLVILILLILGMYSTIHAQSVRKRKPFASVEQMPQYLGGEAALKKYLSESIDVIINKTTDTIPSRVVARLVIESDGSVSECAILRSDLQTYDNRKISKIIKSMPKWTPAKQNGRPVPVYFTLPVTFYTSADKKSIEAYLAIAYEFFSNGEYSKALDQYSEVLAIDSTYSLARLNYAATLVRLDRYDEALQIYEKQYAENPNDFSNLSLSNWGITLEKVGRDEEAIEKFVLEDERGEANTNTYSTWGDILVKEKKYNDAYNKYRRALLSLETEDKVEMLYSKVAYTLLMDEQYEESIEFAARVLSINDKNLYAYRYWALCLIKLGDEEGAIEMLEDALKVDKDDNDANIMLANLYMDMGKEKKAIKLLEEKEKRMKLKNNETTKQMLLNIEGE